MAPRTLRTQCSLCFYPVLYSSKRVQDAGTGPDEVFCGGSSAWGLLQVVLASAVFCNEQMGGSDSQPLIPLTVGLAVPCPSSA